MSDNTYNGWTNYETWRVNLEIFDTYIFDDVSYPISPEYVQDIAEDFVDMSAPDGLAKDYAMAFLNTVNWFEIAAHVNESKKLEDFYNNG
jgi:cyclopropane fatty-acyl-phospholipid synthase-like methyltransferase